MAIFSLKKFASIIGVIMGGNSLGHGQSFVSDNRQIKRCINLAVKSAKSNPMIWQIR